MMPLLLGTKAEELLIDERDWPRCAQCYMPVEFFGVHDTKDSLVFMAQCHGAEEIVTLPDNFWDAAKMDSLSIGPVFLKQGEEYDESLY